MRKRVTEKFLREQDACPEGREYWIEQNKPDLREFCLQALADDHFDYANWLIVRCMDHKAKIRYAVFAAELVLPVFEEEYPSDDRPRKAIEAAKAVIARNTRDNRKAARAAADYDAAAADYAARAARAAARAARAADAADAADAAYYAAYYAADAAYARAPANRAAAYDAAAQAKTAIIQHGLSLVYGEVGR
jgi:hypothetical protein